MMCLVSRLSMLSALIVALASFAHADTIGPNCGTCQGAIYTLSGATPIASGGGNQTFRITLTIDTKGYNGGGGFIDAVAINVSDKTISSSLLDASGGIANWNVVAGGVNGNGCSGSGSGFECADWIGAGRGISVGGILSWTF